MTDTDETIEAWITGSEEAGPTVLASTNPDMTADVRRHMKLTLWHLQTLRDTLPKAAKYAEVCASNSEDARSPTKRLRTRERNMEMAREFNKRAVRRDGLGANRSDLAMMTEIGRLPRFNLKRSAAHVAINAGLAELGRRLIKSG